MAEYKRLKDDFDSTQWYELNGIDPMTGVEFNKSVYGITEDDTVLSVDGWPLTEGDYETIAVRNTI